MMNKRAGIMGSSVISIYRIFLIVAIAFVVFGMSAMAYEYVIDVRDTEALILSRNMVDCIAPSGVVDLGELGGENLFSYCGLGDVEMERFFVSIVVSDDSGELVKLISGDEGLEWIRKLYLGSASTESIDRYEPGYFKKEFDVFILSDDVKINGEASVEVIVRDEK